jgi:hypothetical protein
MSGGLGLGLDTGFGAGASADELHRIVAERLLKMRMAEAMRAAQVDEAQRQQQLDQNDELKRLQIESTRATQQGVQQDRQIGLAHTLADQIPKDTALAPTDPAVGILRTGGRGSLLQHQDPALASTAYSGASTLPTPGQSMQGTNTVTANAGNPEQYIKLASQKQLDTEAERGRKTDADAQRATDAEARLAESSRYHDLLNRVAEGQLGVAQLRAELAKSQADQKAAQGPKLPQREDDTVVSIHQMSPLVDELLAKTQARIATKPKAASGVLGTVKSLPEKAGRLATKAAYSAGLPVAPADSERIQLASLLQILGTVPYLRGIRNMQFVQQIQQHLADPSATDESLVERLQTLKRILPGMERAIYDVHNGGVIPHSHENMGSGGSTGPKVGDVKTFPNGAKAVFDGQGWVKQ